MSRVHGKNTQILVGANDVSAHCKTSALNRGADSHDTTGYGVDDHEFEGGLLNGSFTMGGVYDNDETTGPANAIEPHLGTTVTITRRKEGEGAGKPEQTFSALVVAYNETDPNDGMVTWQADYTVSGAVTKTTQAS